jgi:hypothetical protein
LKAKARRAGSRGEGGGARSVVEDVGEVRRRAAAVAAGQEYGHGTGARAGRGANGLKSDQILLMPYLLSHIRSTIFLSFGIIANIDRIDEY